MGVLGVLQLNKRGLAGNKGGHLIVGVASGEGWNLLAMHNKAYETCPEAVPFLGGGPGVQPSHTRLGKRQRRDPER